MIDYREILDALRQEFVKGATQVDIAKRSGVGRSYICELMSGKSPVDGLSLKKFNQLFPKATVYLYGDKVNIDAPLNSGNVVGVNNGGVIGGSMEPAIDKILASEELSDSEKIKVLKVLKK